MASACEDQTPASNAPAVVLARHIDQLLDDPSGLPREATAAALAAEATPAQPPGAVTVASAPADVQASPPDVARAPDVPVAASASPTADVVASPADVRPAPDVHVTPDAAARPDVAAPIVPIPVRRDGTPIARPEPAKPESKLAKPAPGVPPVKPVKLSAAERKKQAKLAAVQAKSDAKAAAKKAQLDKKKKAQADKKKRAVAAKQKKLDAKKAAEDAKKAAIAAKKAAAWAKKHPHAARPEPAPPPAKAESTPAAKPEAAKPAKAEPVKPTTAAPAAPAGGGDPTELFFSGKRKADAGDFKGAIEDFKASLAARSSPRTLTALGKAYFDAGEMNAAAGALRKAGSAEDAQLLLGTLYQQMDKPEKARKVYEEFLKAHPDHAKADWVRKLLKTL